MPDRTPRGRDRGPVDKPIPAGAGATRTAAMRRARDGEDGDTRPHRPPRPKKDQDEAKAIVDAMLAGPRTPVVRLLEAARAAEGTDRATAYHAYRSAERQVAREAVRLRRRAAVIAAPEAGQLEKTAKTTLRQAAAIAVLMDRVAPAIVTKAPDIPAMPEEDAPPAETPPAAAEIAPPSAVVANNLGGAAAVSWSPSASAPVDGYVVVAVVDGKPRPAVDVPGNLLTTVVGNLPAGSRCRFTVAARKGPLTGSPSLPSNEIVAGPAASFVPLLPRLSAEPVNVVNALAGAKRRLVAEAGELARKWRFDHLKTQAIAAAKDSMLYEQHVASLMAMNLDKVGTAELLLNPVLQSAAQTLTEAAQQLVGLADAGPVDALVGEIAASSAQALLLQRLLLFLAEESPVQFWIGLFGELIEDVASFDGGIPRTRAYLGEVFDSGDVGAKVREVIADIRASLDQEVEQVVAPLREAVAAVVGGTSEAMNEVFGSFDMPLVMEASGGAGLPDTGNVNPLSAVSDRLEQAVDELTRLVKQRIGDALDAQGGRDLFVIVAATYLVLPILAFLVIAIAGGPFSAAALAAAVLLAAQELVRLVLRWLSGPLQRKLDELVDQVVGRVRELHAVFARQATLVEMSSPAPLLEILASELREMKNLLPAEFLGDAAQLLGEARSVVLRTATQLALGAEQAVGMESGTAFDAIAFSYETDLAMADQMPGGTDPNRLAGAAVLRDLGRLEQQRIGLHDGKEMELTQAIPLDDLLPELKRSGQAIVDLTESSLLDSRVPGFYRALVKDVRLTGLLAAGTSSRLVTGGVPMVLTHLGESRTRVKRGANPTAPPLELPEGLRGTSRGFARAVLGTVQQEVADAVRTAYRDAVAARDSGGFSGTPLPPNDPFGKWLDVHDVVRRALAGALPSRVEHEIRRHGAGHVDPAPVLAALAALVAELDLGSVPTCTFTLAEGVNCPKEQDVVDAAVAALPWTKVFPRRGSQVLGGTVFEATESAHRAAVSAFNDRIGKWADAYLVEDPDPDVRSLGFAHLVRPMPEETAVFNLAAAPGGLLPTGLVPVTSGATSTGTDPLQYRPFENRGVEGKFLLRVPVEAAGALTGLTLELVLRGCHDAALGSTLRAGKLRDDAARELVETYAGSVDVGTLGDRLELGDLRTLRISLRSVRDRALLTWLAARQADLANTAKLPAGVPAIPDVSAVAPLGKDEPLLPLPGIPQDEFVVRFRDTAAGAADGLALGNTAIVTPADLGLPGVPDAPLPQGGVASIVSAGLAVIPMPDGVTQIERNKRVDPLGMSVQVPAPLRALLPQTDKKKVVPRLAISPPDAPPVPLDALFGSKPVDLRFGFGDALAGGLVYDVVLSIAYRVPVVTGRPSLDPGVAGSAPGLPGPVDTPPVDTPPVDVPPIVDLPI